MKPETTKLGKLPTNSEAGPIHVRSGALKGYVFANQRSHDAAVSALWADLPATIGIRGPLASGKTRLARCIQEHNGFLFALIVSHRDGRSINIARRNRACVIFDNFMALEESPDFTLMVNALPIPQRKLGSTRIRRVEGSVRPPLIIVTTSEKNVPRFPCLTIDLLDRPSACEAAPRREVPNEA
jgi:hypothetical protein